MPEAIMDGKGDFPRPYRKSRMPRYRAEPPPPCRTAFATLVAQPEEQMDLAEAALLLAKEDYPDLDVARYLARLDAMAREAVAGVPDRAAPEMIRALNAYLFKAQGFRGNSEDYYDPRNSFLNEVLDRRTGIPLSLSMIYMEVGRRAGLSLQGVGMPGHFLVKHVCGGQEILIDPYNAGAILRVEDCQCLLDRLFHGKVPFEPRFLDPVGPRQILSRMLHNLKVIYFNARQYAKAVSVVERLLVLQPACATEIRDRGLLLSQLNAFGRASRDLERYLRMAPGADDSQVIRSHLRALRQRVVALN
jgi:regulator of sirC expression with transglutaminase-like and TPR domain